MGIRWNYDYNKVKTDYKRAYQDICDFFTYLWQYGKLKKGGKDYGQGAEFRRIAKFREAYLSLREHERFLAREATKEVPMPEGIVRYQKKKIKD